MDQAFLTMHFVYVAYLKVLFLRQLMIFRRRCWMKKTVNIFQLIIGIGFFECSDVTYDGLVFVVIG